MTAKRNSRRNPKATRASTVLATAAVLAIGAAGIPAHATPHEQFRFDEQGAQVIDGFCGDLQVSMEFHDSGVVVGRGAGPDGTLRYTVTRHGEATWTNVATRKAFTFVWNTTNQDLRATDNGDGTLSVLWQVAGPEKVYGPDGQRIYNWVGKTDWLTIVDYAGTIDDSSDDAVLSTTFLGLHGPPPPDSDFCDDFRSLTA